MTEAVETNIFDVEEAHENCKVTIWRNSKTGEQSIGWEPQPAGPRCFRCGAKLIWGGDFTYEDYGIDDEEGLVSNLSCPECDAAYEVFTPFK